MSKYPKGHRHRKPPTKRPVALVKWLVNLQYASHSISRRTIESGRVSVGEKVVNTPYVEVDPERDTISVDGLPIRRREDEPVTIIFHKPKGVSGSREDGQHDLYRFLINRVAWYSPKGVLPRTASGIVIVSNDPTHRDPETSFLSQLTADVRVKVSGLHVERELKAVRERLAASSGVSVEDVHVALSERTSRASWLTFKSIRFTLRPISAALKSCGLEVLSWERCRLGPFNSDQLSPGSWRRLNPFELEALESAVASGIDDATPLEDVWAKIIAQAQESERQEGAS